MPDYNKLQINYIRSFARLMSIKDEEKAALEWVNLGLAVKFSEVYRPRYEPKNLQTHCTQVK